MTSSMLILTKRESRARSSTGRVFRMARCYPNVTGTTVASLTAPSSAERVKSTMAPADRLGGANVNEASKGPNWPLEPPMKNPSPSLRPGPALSSRTSQLTWASKAVLVPLILIGEVTRLPGSGVARSMFLVRAPVLPDGMKPDTLGEAELQQLVALSLP